MCWRSLTKVAGSGSATLRTVLVSRISFYVNCNIHHHLRTGAVEAWAEPGRAMAAGAAWGGGALARGPARSRQGDARHVRPAGRHLHAGRHHRVVSQKQRQQFLISSKRSFIFPRRYVQKTIEMCSAVNYVPKEQMLLFLE